MKIFTQVVMLKSISGRMCEKLLGKNVVWDPFGLLGPVLEKERVAFEKNPTNW